MACGCLCARTLKNSHTCNPLKVWNPFLNPFPAKEFVLSFKNEFCKQATPARNVHFLEHGIFWAYAHSQNMSKESYDIFLADGKHFLVATVGCHKSREGVNVQLHIYTRWPPECSAGECFNNNNNPPNPPLPSLSAGWVWKALWVCLLLLLFFWGLQGVWLLFFGGLGASRTLHHQTHTYIPQKRMDSTKDGF